jgi:16S rRNA (cytidine1402-2'-O)-methyltransferase
MSLYIVSLPIGNPDDITLRALHVLQTVTWVAAENPTLTKCLFERHGIHTPLTSYHHRNQVEKSEILLKRIASGETGALVVDEGTPLINDPGTYLVTQAVSHGIRVTPVPGASALLAALCGAAIPHGNGFLFGGQMPHNAASKRRTLRHLREEQRMLVFFEEADRLPDCLEAIREEMGRRRVVLAVDLTKAGERYFRGLVREIQQAIQAHPITGSVTVLIQGKRRATQTRNAF